MNTPACKCFEDAETRTHMERTVNLTSTAMVQQFQLNCNINAVCTTAYPYAVLTAVTLLLRTAANAAATNREESDARLRDLLSTLVADIIDRDEILRATAERYAFGVNVNN